MVDAGCGGAVIYANMQAVDMHSNGHYTLVRAVCNSNELIYGDYL